MVMERLVFQIYAPCGKRLLGKIGTLMAHTPMNFVHCLKIHGLVYQMAAGDGLCYSARDENFSR